ncbi:predicted protein [Naegleria gruberi]|uniref:Predicted protein n=1 Tax=Naegleria gruberi TaxID=5762 RepID=D2V6I0_NAEGR|nr:uncharacterized protein NAEGRDRAFT_47067 [Naegleria gruberi]EFC47576.1 predicted protein [Naegleria gruberi]|eukprot:XP_002680320.1 predicted protein [Naegleria gruberi strain NEG-M]
MQTVTLIIATCLIACILTWCNCQVSTVPPLFKESTLIGGNPFGNSVSALQIPFSAWYFGISPIAGEIYYYNYDLFKIDKSSGFIKSVPLATDRPVIPYFSTFSDNVAYFINGVQGLAVYNFTSGETSVLTEDDPRSILVDDKNNRIYYTMYSASVIKYYDLATKQTNTLISDAGLNDPNTMAIYDGYLYVEGSTSISRVSVSSGIVSNFAGTKGMSGFSASCSIAVDCLFNSISYLTINPQTEELIVSDSGNFRVFAINTKTGVLRTIAGNGNGLSVDKPLENVDALTIEMVPFQVSYWGGKIYVSDYTNNKIFSLRFENGKTLYNGVMGNGKSVFKGDNIKASLLNLRVPNLQYDTKTKDLWIGDSVFGDVVKVSNSDGIAKRIFLDDNLRSFTFDPSTQDVFFYQNSVIKKMSAADKSVSTIIGTNQGKLIDNIPATTASVVDPYGVVVDPSNGDVFISDGYLNCVRKIDGKSGIVTTVAGTGEAGDVGDNGPSNKAQLFSPSGLSLTSSGDLLIADNGNQAIRKVSNGIITTIVSGLDYPSHAIQSPLTNEIFILERNSVKKRFINGSIITIASGMKNPSHMMLKVNANNEEELYVCDTFNNMVKKIVDGSVQVIAGNGKSQTTQFGSLATETSVPTPGGIVFNQKTNEIYITTGDMIMRIDSNSKINGVLGDDRSYLTSRGDNLPVSETLLNIPQGLAIFDNNLFIVDMQNNRIRKMPLTGLDKNPIVSVVMGGVGDGGLAINALIGTVYGSMKMTKSGDLIFNEQTRIRKITKDGVISTIAGNGLSIKTIPPKDNVVSTSSSILVNEFFYDEVVNELYLMNNSTIRKVSKDGVITTIAGQSGLIGLSGDGDKAANSKLNIPTGVAVTKKGNIIIADTINGRLRMINNDTGVITTIAGAENDKLVLDNPHSIILTENGELIISVTNQIKVLTPFCANIENYNYTLDPISKFECVCSSQNCFKLSSAFTNYQTSGLTFISIGFLLLGLL